MSQMFDAVLSRRSLVKTSVAAGTLAALPVSFQLASAQDAPIVWMVTDTAGLGDQNFNDLANRGGTKAAAELGVNWKVTESTDQASYVPNLSSAADGGAQLVVAVGFLLTDAVTEVAAQYPDTFFQLIDSVAEVGNVQSVLFKEQQIGYLAGIVAGKVTKSNKIGVVGGQRIPPVIRYEVGFVAGVKSVNDDAEVIINYTDTFGDQDLGKQTAAAQFNQGADIVFPIAGFTGTGAYLAAAELNKMGEIWVIGVDAAQDHLAPGYELCVAQKGVDFAVFEAAKSIVDGNFKAGTLDLGLAEGGVSIVMYEGRVPADVAALTHGYEAAIIAGTIVPPVDDDTAKTFEVPAAPEPIEGTPQAATPVA
ncbi:MAG TPA: BMP family ABC transporter substrate-binding protein [Thermomicrobiales bacterium]|nr:BMP family ABC transporter substrate-binding protein [Thermomicrobiales bacterium]HRA46890.1 BMP family ABC transporter substrate-binding protein [Thermomicrobiales bacterium]